MVLETALDTDATHLRGEIVARYTGLLSYVNGAGLACGPVVDGYEGARFDPGVLVATVETLEVDREPLI